MLLWHFHRLFVYYFLNFDNCDFKVKSCFVLFLQIKNVNYNSNKFIWGKQTSINKHLFRDCVTLYMADGFASEYQDGVASDRCFPFLFFLIDSSNKYQYDSKAFLFSLVNKPGWAPVKLPQTGKYSSRRKYSVCFRSSYGPTFGGGKEIYISNYASSNSHSYSNLGDTYSSPGGHSYSSIFSQTFLAGTHHFTPDEVETFYESN